MPLNKSSFDDNWTKEPRFRAWMAKADCVYEARQPLQKDICGR